MIQLKTILRFQRSTKLRFPHLTTTPILCAVTLALHLCPSIVAPIHAQGTRKDDIVFNSRGIPLAGATVRVCVMPASGQPCSPLALLYSDPALTQAIANPTTTDGLGNYFFYAAPGKYEIEISGPGITTKQLPNVILPNDPASPTFTGAISAFSLSLSGNLSVTGNTSVIGSLASGTLNLTNQGSPPGSASPGTVNLYTKSTDKRLYYKDELGTEIGPIASASGAQTNIINTFTAQQNFDSDLETKGPNPHFSFSRYGGYNSTTATPPSTTGSITASSTTLTLASAQDFANGQGIVVYKAGSATTLTTPGTPTVTPINLLNGSTTYNYRVIAEDRTGGLTAASTVAGTTTGAATLGANTITLTTCSRTSGVATYTSSSSHNLQAGAQVNITGFSGFGTLCNGVKTIAATPTSTTFTTNDGKAIDETNTGGTPLVTVYACNTLSFPSGTYSGPNTLHYWIYRQIGAGAFSLVGVAQGLDPWWTDCAIAAPSVPAYVPSTPPGAAQPGYLATTITSGGGTTTLTLANAASTTATSQAVLHDNSVPLKNAIQAAASSGGGTVYIPNGANSPFWVFNSTADFNSGISYGSAVVRIHINSSNVWLNQPWIAHTAMDYEGEPRVTTSFSYVNGGQIVGGTAYPLLLVPEIGASANHFSRLQLICGQPQQSCIYADEGPDGGGPTGLVWDDVNFNGNGASTPVVIKGGFDFFFNRGNCQVTIASFVPFSCLQLTNASIAVTAGGPGQVAGRVQVKGLYFANSAIGIDCLPNPVNVASVDYIFDTTIFESAISPYLRLNCPNGVFSGISMIDVAESDSISGFGTPLIDSQNDGAIGSISWTGGLVSSASQPALIVGSGQGNLVLIAAPFNNPGNASYTALVGGTISATSAIGALNNGRVESVMPAPAPPGIAISSGGAVPVGTQQYTLQWLDVDGDYSSPSNFANAVVTTGNQTVTLTIPTPPAGAVSYLPYRNGALANVTAFGSCAGVYAAGIPVTTTNFVDTSSFPCGNSVAGGPAAGISILGPNGLSGPKLRLVNNGSVLSGSFPNNLTANRTLSIPDATGYLPTTSYLNSAFDNATRANGAIGSNWTVTNANTLNIASNNFVGTGSNSVAYWSASPFSPVQFSQATLTALNGTTDFPGVAVLLSGSGSGTQGYNCVEDTTNIFIQKISGTTNTTLTSSSTTGAAGDVLRLEAASGGALTCYKNGVSALTTTDTSYSTGQPGLFLFGTVATAKNWSGGNLHPLSQLDVESDWTRGQHLAGNAVSCTMSAGTTCTVTLASSSWHACNAQPQGSTPIAAACSISGTTLTVTAASSNSQTWGIFLY
jgi:hypothetical protein